MSYYTVAETWEQSPADPTQGEWIYTVILDGEFIREFRCESNAQRHADILNEQAA